MENQVERYYMMKTQNFQPVKSKEKFLYCMYNLLLFDKCLQCYRCACVFILLSHCAILSYCKYQHLQPTVSLFIQSYPIILRALQFSMQLSLPVSQCTEFVSYIIVTCIYMCTSDQCLKNQVTVKYWPNTSA